MSVTNSETTGAPDETPKLRESDFPSVDEILPYLLDIPRRVEPEMREHESEEPGIDVRLQVWEDGAWTIHTGDASYDTDHRGFWGAGCVTADDTPETLRELADELREQAMDDAAQCDMLDQEEEG